MYPSLLERNHTSRPPTVSSQSWTSSAYQWLTWCRLGCWPRWLKISSSTIYFRPNLISWCSLKQSIVARSSAKAEYRSLTLTIAEVIWVQTFLQELHVHIASSTIHCDNQSTLDMAHNPVLHAPTKHMEIDLFFIREKVLSKQLSVLHILAFV